MEHARRGSVAVEPGAEPAQRLDAHELVGGQLGPQHGQGREPLVDGHEVLALRHQLQVSTVTPGP